MKRAAKFVLDEPRGGYWAGLMAIRDNTIFDISAFECNEERDASFLPDTKFC